MGSLKANLYTLALPLILLGLVMFFLFKGDSKSLSGGDKKHLDPSRFLILPMYAKGNEVALALDGGDLPIGTGQVPSILLGKNILRTVHLAWLHDWTQPACRATYKNLVTLYASQEGHSLPALRIYLNPVSSDPAGEELHRAMLQIFFRANTRDSYISIANEMSIGELSANAEAIRKRVEVTDPILFFDWDTKLEWLEDDIAKTLAIAKVQRARNISVTANRSFDQLTSTLSILPSETDQRELIDFLENASATQRAWMQTQSVSFD